jgi:hypothetical protein
MLQADYFTVNIMNDKVPKIGKPRGRIRHLKVSKEADPRELSVGDAGYGKLFSQRGEVAA